MELVLGEGAVEQEVILRDVVDGHRWRCGELQVETLCSLVVREGEQALGEPEDAQSRKPKLTRELRPRPGCSGTYAGLVGRVEVLVMRGGDVLQVREEASASVCKAGCEGARAGLGSYQGLRLRGTLAGPGV